MPTVSETKPIRNSLLLYMSSTNATESCLAGYEADYLYDWTILKYQEIQKAKAQNLSIVRNYFVKF
jgi:hypothetical protein